MMAQRHTVPRPGELVLEIARVFSVPVPAVFAAFDDSNEFRKWWGPKGFSITSLDFQPQVGEQYRMEMQPPDGKAFYLIGEFCVVDRPVRLAYTFAYEEPGRDDIETLVSLAFSDLGGSTEVFLSQGPFKTEARCALHRDGWIDSFDKLDRFLVAST